MPLPVNHPYKKFPPVIDYEEVLWTPQQIETALWLDASDNATITLNGSTISQWSDKSGNGRHATQGAAGAQPTLETNRLSFDGGDYLSVADTVGLQFGTGAFAVVVVANFTNVSKGPSAQNTLVCKNYTGFELSNYQGTVAGYIGGTGGATVSGLVSGEWCICSQIRMANLYTVRRNGNSSTAASNTTNASNVGQALLIGARPDLSATTTLTGKVSEIIILPSGFTETDLRMIESYAAHKWDKVFGITAIRDALPISHPYKFKPPVIEKPLNYFTPMNLEGR